MSETNTQVIDLTEVDETSVFKYEVAPTRKLRSWFGTRNNYTPEQADAMVAKIESIGYTRAVIGKEVGESGTPHLQWMVTFKDAYHWNDVRLFFEGSHVEACRNADAAAKYCAKEAIFWESDKRQQGNRTDLKKVQDMIERGHDLREVAMSAPSTFMKYPGGVQKYYELFNSNKTRSESWELAEHAWFFGPTACGKTKFAVKSMRDRDITFWKSSITTNGFWNGYDMQEGIIFDEVRGDLMKFHQWLEVLDIYEHRVNIKNSSRNIVSDNIIITSNVDPYTMWKNRSEEDIKQLIRRINGGIWEFKASGRTDENGRPVLLPPVNVTQKLAAEYAKVPPAFENFVNGTQTSDNTIRFDYDAVSDDDVDEDIRNRPPTPGPMNNRIAPPPAPKKQKFGVNQWKD